MANPTTNYGWPMPTSTDLVTDLPADFAAFGQPVDTSLKALNPETTLGDIAYRSATANTNTRLGIGSTGQVLTVAGGVPTWAASAGGGKILQVVNATTTTSTVIASASMTDTTITATITPTLATSKILVLITGQYEAYRNTTNNNINARIMRDATAIASWTGGYFGGIEAGNSGAGVWLYMTGTWTWLDSPATTSATTYKLQSCVKNTANSGSVNWQIGSVPSGITLLEVGV